MASADLRKELECPICLTIYTDPVILRCGHNFCRVCIVHKLDTQGRYGQYYCPICRQKFVERPALQRNIALKKTADSFLSAQKDQKTSMWFTYHVDSPVPAGMSCLTCDTSLGDKHLIVHSKETEHVLPEDTSLEKNKCSLHKELLKYYCTEDDTCICMSCRLVGEHLEHWVETLNDASEKKKMKLRNHLQKLMAETEETEKRVQSLEERRRKAQQKAAGEKKTVTALFKVLNKKLNKLKLGVLSDITEQAEKVSVSYDEVIGQLEVNKEELSRKMHHIEELCNMTDPLTVLQESDTGDLCDTEDRERRDKQLHDGGDLDVASISHTLHTGLSDIMSGVIVQKHTDTQAYPHSSTEDKVPITAKLSRPRPQPIKSDVPVYADILLNINTAGDKLRISDDRKTASWSHRRQNRPETLERFQDRPQVLGNQRFSSGRHYWEVDVGGSEWWRVGMCYPSIARRGGQSGIGNNKSWCLYRDGDQYSVIHDRKEIQLHTKIRSNRVRISLDYEAGQISFYDLCDPIRHLHTFTARFTEYLYAGLWLGQGYIKISRWTH